MYSWGNLEVASSILQYQQLAKLCPVNEQREEEGATEHCIYHISSNSSRAVY